MVQKRMGKINKIWQFIIGLFSKKQAKTDARVQSLEEEIPRYPPFAKGLPLASVEKILDTQKRILNEIRREVGNDAFAAYYLPCIKSYCEFVHLLPASERNHHRGAGGLFRHGLEVAVNSLRYGRHKLFDANLSPSEIESNRPKWDLACFLSGLVHDIGKPLSDYQIISECGQFIWNPFTESIPKWGEKNKLDKYYLHWLKGRYRKHESLSSVVAKRIIHDDALSFLTTSGNLIIRNMFECVTGQPAFDNKLFELVKKSDHFSTENDLKKANLRGDDVNLSIPLNKYILDAIKIMNIRNDWGSDFNNSPPLIYIDKSLYLTAKAISRITEKLADSKIPGVPWDKQALTDSLVNTDFAQERALGDGSVSNMWTLKKKGSDRVVWAVRLVDWSIVFQDEPDFQEEYSLLTEKQLAEINSSQQDKEKKKPSKGLPPNVTENTDPVDPVSHGKPEEVIAVKAVTEAIAEPPQPAQKTSQEEAVNAAAEEVEVASESGKGLEPEEEMIEASESSEPLPQDTLNHTEQQSPLTEEDIKPLEPIKKDSEQSSTESNATAEHSQVSHGKPQEKIELPKGIDAKVLEKLSLIVLKNPPVHDITESGELVLYWSVLPEAFEDGADILNELMPSLEKNKMGKYSHTYKDKPVLMVKKSYLKLTTFKKDVSESEAAPAPVKPKAKSVDIEKIAEKSTEKEPVKIISEAKKKAATKPKAKKKPKEPSGIKGHREVPLDFDPDNAGTDIPQDNMEGKKPKSTFNADKPSGDKDKNIDNSTQGKYERIKALVVIKKGNDTPFNRYEAGEIDLKGLVDLLSVQYKNNNFILKKIKDVYTESNG